jgi:hypothetical protein
MKKKLTTILIVSAITILIAEIASFIALKILFKDETSINSFTRINNCSYYELLFPHPYLGYTYSKNCSHSHTYSVNKSGMIADKEMPSQRDDKVFYIMVTGGSVADQFGFFSTEIFSTNNIKNNVVKNYLETYLNENYLPPHKEKFSVVKSASGGWKQPQQAISTLMYSSVVDGIVTLDGFNEHYEIVNPWVKLDIPSSNFGQMTDLNFVKKGYLNTILHLNASLNRSFLLGRSNTVTLIFKSLSKILNSSNYYGDDVANLQSTYSSAFSFPADWSEEKRRNYNLNRYSEYIRTMSAISALNKTKISFFIQPTPAANKKLTEEEKTVVGKLDYLEIFSLMEKHLLKLKKESIDISSLSTAFKNVNESIYSDSIHFKFDNKTMTSLGNEILAQKIGDHIARTWGFRKKSN